MNHTDERQLDRTLWAAQWILAGAFEFIGMVKLGLTADQARQHFGLPADSTTRMLHAAGAVEVAIALVVILPGVTRFSQLCTVAAGGLGAIALLGLFRPAIAAGAGIAGGDLVLVALAAACVWGRRTHPPSVEVPRAGPDRGPSRSAQSRPDPLGRAGGPRRRRRV